MSFVCRLSLELTGCVFALTAFAGCADPPPPVAPPPVVAVPAPSGSASPVGSVVADMRKEARDYAPLVKSGLVKEFLAGVDDLPPQAPRRLWHDAGKKRY